MRLWKDDLLEQRKGSMERKLERAEQKRQLQLRQIIKKAKEAETKVRKIYPYVCVVLHVCVCVVLSSQT